MVNATSEDWKIFETDDGFFEIDALSVVGEDLICIAASFMGTARIEYTRLYKFDHGMWTAEDMDEQIISAVNLCGRYDITADETINMLFVTYEGRVFTVGAENNQYFLQDKITINNDMLVSFMNQKIIDDKLFLFGLDLIVEYSHGQWQNISDKLYRWTLDDQSYSFDDIEVIDGEYFLYGGDGDRLLLLMRPVGKKNWVDLNLQFEMPNSLQNMVHRDDFLYIFSGKNIGKMDLKTKEITYSRFPPIRAKFPPIHADKVVFYNGSFLGINWRDIFNLSDNNRSILPDYEQKWNKNISFFIKYEIFNDILYVFGVRGSLIKINKDEVAIFEMPNLIK